MHDDLYHAFHPMARRIGEHCLHVVFDSRRWRPFGVWTMTVVKSPRDACDAVAPFLFFILKRTSESARTLKYFKDVGVRSYLRRRRVQFIQHESVFCVSLCWCFVINVHAWLKKFPESLTLGTSYGNNDDKMYHYALGATRTRAGDLIQTLLTFLLSLYTRRYPYRSAWSGFRRDRAGGADMKLFVRTVYSRMPVVIFPCAFIIFFHNHNTDTVFTYIFSPSLQR